MRDKTEYMVVEFSKAILLYGIVALSLIGLGLFSFISICSKSKASTSFLVVKVSMLSVRNFIWEVFLSLIDLPK